MSSTLSYLLLHFPHLQNIHPLVIITVLIIIAAIICTGFIFIISFCVTWINRKISIIIKGRGTLASGCGWDHWLQPIKDGVKLLFKQDIIPVYTDRILFHLTPLLIFVPIFTAFVTIPFSNVFHIVNLNIGLFYILTVMIFSALGLVIAGLAPDNKWSLYGALREISLITSYIIPLGLSMIPIIMIVGSLDLQEFIKHQNGGIRNWLIVTHFPFNFLSFITFFITSLAIVHRNPFKTSEDNSEIVAGIYTEYSGIRLGLLYITRHASIFILSAVSVILFLGGWQSPFSFTASVPDIIWFFIKIAFLVIFQSWVHWSLPTMRIDQTLYFFWKVVVPISLINVIGSGILMIVNEL